MKFFKKKPIKQIADYSMWHEIRRRKRAEMFKKIGFPFDLAANAIKGFGLAAKNAGYSIREFNEAMKRVQKITKDHEAN